MKKLVLIDGHSIMSRAFYGIPLLTNAAGEHTNAVYGFLNILFKVLDEEKADCLAVAFDLKAPTFRHLKYKEYKGTRKPMPEELHEQIAYMKEFLGAMNVPILTKEGYEADDIIGTVAKRFQKEGMEVSIVSGDRDLLQLADTHIRVRIPKTSKGKTEVFDYYPEDVKKQYLVTPEEFIDVKALMGDASDNIPGVPSIGEKTATQIIAAYHSIENAYAHLSELKPPRAAKALGEHYEDAQFSKWLATICLEVPVEVTAEEIAIGDLYTPEAYRLCRRFELRNMLKRFEESARAGADALTGAKEPSVGEITDLSGAEAFFASLAAKKDEPVGIELSERGLSVASDPDHVTVIRKENFIDDEYLADRVRQILDSGRTVRCMELKPILHRIGAEERSNAEDISVAAYLLNPLQSAYRAEDIAKAFTDRLIPMESEDPDRSFIMKSLVALEAGPVLFAALSEAGMEKLYREIELPLIYALAEMEMNGIRADGKRLKEFAAQLEAGIREAEEEIYRETGHEFNINSPKQLGEVLFEEMKLPFGKKTKTGYSTGAEILDKLAPDHPIVKRILDYRTLTKLNSTYATGLGAFIQEDGRIHGTFNQTITATGRISSTEPNLQNIPVRTEMGSRIRDVFTPADGYVFIDADYSQIELRVLASMSGDENLIGAYRHAVDIHAVTASQVFHVPLEEVTPLLRRNAKAVNFGVVYGISAFGLSEGLSISRREALDYINNYFKTYPGVKEFLDRQVREAKELGYVTTLYGRRRPIPELKSSNFMQRSFGERVAMNSPIQGTAADIMKIAMVNVRRALKEQYPEARIVLQVHDELLVEAREADADGVLALVRDTMRQAADLKVTLEVDARKGASWLEAH